ncbi:MAG: AAA family ATPase [Candidatus Pacebacteria bacterium]|nr:AAA family ATPase [Candidatus Paceibacterota bacterium]MDD5357458.1 AAA family ATPase [Candidatus Paceibacterota bacterium]
MQSKKFILIIYGASCAGKSTITEELMKVVPEMFHIRKDKIKWFISQYESMMHNDMLHNMAYDLGKRAVKDGLSLIMEGTPKVESGLWKNYKKLADENGMAFYEVNMEADLEVLKKRFQERVDNMHTSGRKLANKSMEHFLFLHDLYLKSKHEGIPTFYSDKQSVEEITGEILKIIGN